MVKKPRKATLEKIEKILELQQQGNTKEQIIEILNLPNLNIFMNQQGYVVKEGKFVLKEQPEIEGQLSMLESKTIEQQPEETEPDTTSITAAAEVIETSPDNEHNMNITIFKENELNNRLMWVLSNVEQLQQLLENKQKEQFETIQLTFNLDDSFSNTTMRVAAETKKKWIDFLNDWKEYRSQELVTQALEEFMENHQKQK